MTYFRNKFDDQFLNLARTIEPKGMEATKLSNYSNEFTEYRRNSGTGHVKVIPLILYNILESTNSRDRSVDNYIMLCEADATTAITAIWDETYHKQHTDYICDLIYNKTGDFKDDSEEDL